ncbi:molybdopterin molybdenumtransferase MoeA [Azoarcus sp. TTM-91]|uniref:molybdopterin molybdotransferase MoeA n=1 Tax=Azoarcus sp. TTM-91 TaxID=2691581 RepID=UPI00145D69A6|nr:gephyrin-like molybdotransferase Glp [Azoarcus sp. TTM-91]NMG35822.1 molybdopterin molybdenumtransferase MoeA [Azoarcus sp. TTM-91]
MSSLPGSPPLGVVDARSAILERVQPLSGAEIQPLATALGRVLAADVISPLDVPAHDNSAMDGYALRAADLSAGGESRLQVAGTALAGMPHAGELGSGQAIRIMTGAVVPTGADTIVMQEVVRREGELLFVPPGQQAGQNVRRRGEDLAAGSVALPAGRLLGPAELGLAASLGLSELSVRRRPRVAVFSTGDEIASIGTPLGAGQIYDSNRYTLHGMLTRLGCEIVDLGVVADRPGELEAAFGHAAATADAIVTSGGVSVGDADFVRDIMARLGEVAFWRISMKPGRPMAFGRLGTALLFGLPGNPVATMVAFYQFVQPALLKLMGVSPLPEPQLFEAVSREAIRKPAGRTEFLRGRLSRVDGRLRVSLTGAQGSGILRSMSEADCFILLDEARGDVQAGETVPVQPFHGLI